MVSAVLPYMFKRMPRMFNPPVRGFRNFAPNFNQGTKLKMKRTLIKLLFCSLTPLSVLAAPVTETLSDGTLKITVSAANDLSKNNFSTGQLAVEKIKIVTDNGYALSSEDMITLCGSNRPSETIFKNMSVLDLSDADLVSDNDYTYLNLLSSQLKRFTFSKSLKSIPDNLMSASSNSTVLEEVIIPDNINGKDANVTIGSQAFQAMPNLKHVVIGTGVQTIGASAFAECGNLESVDFHEGIKSIEGGAFTNAWKLAKIVIPEGVETIGYRAFANTGITSLRLPNTLKRIGREAFDNTLISVVVIPPSVEYIESQAFQKLPNLTDVYVLGTQTKAEARAFQNDMTYAGYEYSDNGDDVTDRLDWVRSGGQHPVVLHYVEEAYENYAHDFLKYIKTGDSRYDHNYANSMSQLDTVHIDGNIIPKNEIWQFQNNISQDYGGWNEFFMTYDDAAKAVFLEERVIDGRWYSICYPFDMTATQIGDAFGNATEIREFSGVNMQQNGDSKRITLLFTEPVTETKAHHPYMIYPGTHSSQTSVNYIVGVKNLMADTKEERKAQLASESVTYLVDNVSYCFIGNYEEEGEYIPKNSYYYYGGDSQYAKGFYKTNKANSVSFTVNSAIITMDNDNGSNHAKAVYDADIESEATGINSAAAPYTKHDRRIYNLNGQAVNTVSKGVYIYNGKKYIVK